MAEDFIPGFAKTVRVKHDGNDLSRDLNLLENAELGVRGTDDDTGDDEKGDQVIMFYDVPPDHNINRTTTTLDTDYQDGYGIEDLLNGYVVDEETIGAVDEALITIISEWSTIDELTSNGRDIERYDALMESKCPDAYYLLKSKLTDSANEIYEKLMRISRWILKAGLVLKNEKMVYVPV